MNNNKNKNNKDSFNFHLPPPSMPRTPHPFTTIHFSPHVPPPNFQHSRPPHAPPCFQERLPNFNHRPLYTSNFQQRLPHFQERPHFQQRPNVQERPHFQQRPPSFLQILPPTNVPPPNFQQILNRASHFNQQSSRDFNSKHSSDCPLPLSQSLSLTNYCQPPTNFFNSHLDYFETDGPEENTLNSKLCIPTNTMEKESLYHPLNNSIRSLKKDQEWVNQWFEKKLSRNKLSIKKVIPKNISDVHQDVAIFRGCLSSLKNEDDTSIDVKKKLSELSAMITSPNYLDKVNKLVTERKKKRNRQRISKKLRKQRCVKKGQQIDKKRQFIIDAEKNTKMQKQLRLEADSVLKEVRTKQSDSINLLKLLSRIEELRENRLKRGSQQGHISDEKQNNYFKTISGGLREMVDSQFKDYLQEENTLNVMIDQHQIDDKVKLMIHKGVSTSDISSVYFGHMTPVDVSLLESYTAANTSTEMFNNRRYLWDTHLSVEGYEIPVQWALPSSGDASWRKWRVQK